MTRWTIPTDAPAPVPGKPQITHDEARALSDAVYAHMSAQNPREPADALATIRHLRERVAALEAALTNIAFLARDGACDMKGRRHDENFDTQMEVTRDPCGAFMTIEAMSMQFDAIKNAALNPEARHD